MENAPRTINVPLPGARTVVVPAFEGLDLGAHRVRDGLAGGWLIVDQFWVRVRCRLTAAAGRMPDPVVAHG